MRKTDIEEHRKKRKERRVAKSGQVAELSKRDDVTGKVIILLSNDKKNLKIII